MPAQETQYHDELKRLRKGFRDGNITRVAAGEDITLRGTGWLSGKLIHTMEVTFKDQQCHAYMMLRRRGRYDDADHTPYFFGREDTRDSAIKWITKAAKTK